MIHYFLFQDVYEWAGKFRCVNMGRPGKVIFAHFGQLEQYLSGVFRKLAQENQLRAVKEMSEFATRAAYYLGEINAAHPFRDGNGRTQREFVRQLADEAGFDIFWNRVQRERLYEASEISFASGNNGALAEVLKLALARKV